MSNQAQDTKFFDLHTSGIGYLNRIREVPIRKGTLFSPLPSQPFVVPRTTSNILHRLQRRRRRS
jgi:hypothetical protein